MAWGAGALAGFLALGAPVIRRTDGVHLRPQGMATIVPTSATQPPACLQSRWTRPKPITKNRADRAVARGGNIAASPDNRAYVIGNDIMLFDGQPVREAPFSAWEVGGRALGRPSGRFMFVLPKGMVDARGVLHVLWAEPRGGPRAVSTFEWPPTHLSRVWAASYERRTGWSAPVQIYQGTPLNWALASIVDDQTTPERYPGVVVPTWGQESGQGIFYLRLRNGRWEGSESPISTQGSAGYPALVRTGSRILLAYVSAAPDAPRDVNSVFLRRSDDDGRTWGPASLVSRSGAQAAHDLRAVRGNRGQVHLVWLRRLDEPSKIGAARSVVRHVATHDGGATWSAPDDLGPAAARTGLRAAVDACGTVHVIYADRRMGADRVRLAHATWKGRWFDAAVVFPSLTAVDADLHASADRGLMLAFLARAVASTPTTPFAMVYSKLRPLP